MSISKLYNPVISSIRRDVAAGQDGCGAIACADQQGKQHVSIEAERLNALDALIKDLLHRVNDLRGYL
ncbi:MAG: hypothetical protein EBW55_09540 [Betaproteobacteria bacterium]|nr:hypothetical protein [Betaproteobacteria bacterium]